MEKEGYGASIILVMLVSWIAEHPKHKLNKTENLKSKLKPVFLLISYVMF